MLLRGNCLELVAEMPDNSVDSIVTDPPYELGFMGKAWDNSGIAYSVQLWTECLRVLKPGGHLLAFGGSRTYHRLACAVEDAGFEVRDQIMWLYGSGFPKSLDVSKAIDKQGGENIGWFIDLCLKVAEEKGITKKQLTDLFPSKNGKTTGWLYNKASHAQSISPEQFNVLRDFLDLPYADLAEAKREIVGYKEAGMGSGETFGMRQAEGDNANANKIVPITAPATPEAQQWQGWGTALKPAHEPIVVARKPLTGTVASNVLEWGTGALNIDGSRVEMGDEYDPTKIQRQTSTSAGMKGIGGSGFRADHEQATYNAQGRWPANIIHDGLEEEWSRYFYCAKASKSERNAGLEGLPELPGPDTLNSRRREKSGNRSSSARQNFHPTVKPLALMRYLIKLVTPLGGTVLDPFLGSGSTAVACVLEGFDWVGCEMTEDYWPIIEARVEWAHNQPKTLL